MKMKEAMRELLEAQSWMAVTPKHTLAYEHAKNRADLMRHIIKQLENEPVKLDDEQQ
jgi:hypothetical protein